MTSGEIAPATSVLKSTIQYNTVWIHHGSYLPFNLQDLTRCLNALDERKGKYLTGSELKSMMFTIMQNFGRTVSVAEQLYQLSQTENGTPVPAALLLQTDIHLNQLLNRYALIKQQTTTP